MKKFFLISLALLALLLAGCATSTTTNSATGNAAVVNGEDEFIKIPLSELSTTASYYSIQDGNTELRYFIVLDSKGNPKTAFDGCEVCGGAKGYAQQGTDMICRNCGRSFKIDELGTKNTGRGCWPGFLPHTIQDGDVVINKRDLINGKSMFA